MIAARAAQKACVGAHLSLDVSVAQHSASPSPAPSA
jgi:hypothetical protein